MKQYTSGNMRVDLAEMGSQVQFGTKRKIPASGEFHSLLHPHLRDMPDHVLERWENVQLKLLDPVSQNVKSCTSS